MTESVAQIGSVVLTKELVRAIYHGGESMLYRARECERTPEYNDGNATGRILRRQAEEDRQRYALLSDWVKRFRSEVGLTEDEVGV